MDGWMNRLISVVFQTALLIDELCWKTGGQIVGNSSNVMAYDVFYCSSQNKDSKSVEVPYEIAIKYTEVSLNDSIPSPMNIFFQRWSSVGGLSCQSFEFLPEILNMESYSCFDVLLLGNV